LIDPGCNIAKELLVDEEINDYIDAEILGLSPTSKRSFDFVQSKVYAQLSHLSRQSQDTIVSPLETYEQSVFETRTMRTWPLTINGTWISQRRKSPGP